MIDLLTYVFDWLKFLGAAAVLAFIAYAVMVDGTDTRGRKDARRETARNRHLPPPQRRP